jgi:branched-chain amino acid transport system permease protein
MGLQKNIIAIALVILFFIAFPWIFEKSFAHHLMILIFLYAFMGTAWNILGGYTGQVSLGHSVYFGIGAYTSTCLLIWYGLSPWLGMIPGIILAVIVSLIVGYPCFRLKGHYFAIATICVGEIIHLLFLNWPLIGGAVGLYLPIIPSSFINFEFHKSKLPYYYIILFFLLLAIGTTAWISRNRLGFYLRAIKEDQDAARSIGISATRYKMIAMGLSAAFTAIAGTFYAQYILYIDPTSVLLLQLSIQMCVIAVLGGTGTILGPLIGAAILIPLSEFTRFYLGGQGQGIDLMIYGGLIMVISAYKPAGLMGLFQKKEQV